MKSLATMVALVGSGAVCFFICVVAGCGVATERTNIAWQKEVPPEQMAPILVKLFFERNPPDNIVPTIRKMGQGEWVASTEAEQREIVEAIRDHTESFGRDNLDLISGSSHGTEFILIVNGECDALVIGIDMFGFTMGNRPGGFRFVNAPLSDALMRVLEKRGALTGEHGAYYKACLLRGADKLPICRPVLVDPSMTQEKLDALLRERGE